MPFLSKASYENFSSPLRTFLLATPGLLFSRTIQNRNFLRHPIHRQNSPGVTGAASVPRSAMPDSDGGSDIRESWEIVETPFSNVVEESWWAVSCSSPP
jgi:hypothetical protein